MDLTPYKNCLALTNSIFISNEAKHYRPCCWFRTDIDAKDYVDYQQQLSQMDLEYNCDYCIKQDQGGEYSYRQQFTNPEQLIFTCSFDNICNLKCVTCTPSNSTQIIQEMFEGFDENYTINGRTKKQFLKIQQQAPNKIEFIKNTLATTKFENLRFDILGGEPLINPAIFEFLDWLAELPYSKNIGLSITTNGTTYNEKMVKYLEKFAYVNIQLSIDGINEEYEYLRFGNDFATLENVSDKFYSLSKQYNNFTVASHYTLSWMNCLHFAQYFNWAQNRYPNWVNMYVSKLEQPSKYSIDTLSLNTRTKILEKVLTEINEPVNEVYKQGLYLYKEHMSSTTQNNFNQELFNLGVKDVKFVGKRRNLDLTSVLADILEFVEENK